MADLEALGAALGSEARRARHRRLVVCHGSRDAPVRAAARVLAGADVAASERLVVAPAPLDGLRGPRVPPDETADVLGTTHAAVVLDARDGLRPDVLGRIVGTVDGGGLLVLATPPLDAWPKRRGTFDESLAVPPHTVSDVGTRFRSRLVRTLGAHDGIAIVDADTDEIEREGQVGTVEPADEPAPTLPPDPVFPEATYRRCWTQDQVAVVRALEGLGDAERAVVVEADRGRGKSSAAGLAAGALAWDGRDVVVCAPSRRSAREVFRRAGELVHALGGPDESGGGDVETPAGGRVRYVRPADLDGVRDPPDAVVIDEAAALPVGLLTSLLDWDAGLAFVTTIHGYEGAGRGFSVRFRDRLADSPRRVVHRTMERPIRYAADDPVERWAFHALLLDARPVPSEVASEASPGGTTYTALEPDDLVQDEQRLREAFGLLVLAHYRTSPDDLARLLDAPNLSVRALLHEDHVVSVALVAREGGLPADRRRALYEGGTVRGHMIPDVLTSQLRDPDAAEPEGVRVMRIATHEAARSRGLGSKLLDRIRDELDADWFGTSYGATPDLMRFWRPSGYRTVHLATSRHPASGEHSTIMMDAVTEAGRTLVSRSQDWFVRRLPSALPDGLSDLDPDVVRLALRGAEVEVPLDLTDREWRVVAASAWGPGIYDVAPRPFRRLAVRHLVEREAPLDDAAERLLVRKVLQAWPWDDVVADLGYVSRRMCMRALGEAYRPLVDRYGGAAAREEADRYRS